MSALFLGPDRYDRRVRIDGDRIAAVGFDLEPEAAASVLAADDALIESGRVNAHTHIYSGLAPFGVPPPEPAPESFVQILERLWWRLDRALDRRSLRASARYYVAESLLAGTSTLIDHHESPDFIGGSLDVLAEACDELGMRAVICFGATERNGGREEGRRGLAECRRFIAENRRPLVRGVVSLHASFTASDETIREAAALCRELETVLHVHLAEDGADVVDAKERGYPGPLERLLELDALPPGSILAHGVHLEAAQVRMAAAAGAWIVQNPRSNRGNDVGYPRHLGASARVALGTDGYPSRLGEEVEALQSEAEAHGETWEVAGPRVEGGHRMAEELFGVSLAPLVVGGAADVGVFAGDGARHLVVGGRVVVRDGSLVTGDADAIRAEAKLEAPRLWERMRALDDAGDQEGD